MQILQKSSFFSGVTLPLSPACAYPEYSTDISPYVSRFQAGKELERLAKSLREDSEFPEAAAAHAYLKICRLREETAANGALVRLSKELEALEETAHALLQGANSGIIEPAELGRSLTMECEINADRQKVLLGIELSYVRAEAREEFLNEAKRLSTKAAGVAELAEFRDFLDKIHNNNLNAEGRSEKEIAAQVAVRKDEQNSAPPAAVEQGRAAPAAASAAAKQEGTADAAKSSVQAAAAANPALRAQQLLPGPAGLSALFACHSALERVSQAAENCLRLEKELHEAVERKDDEMTVALEYEQRETAQKAAADLDELTTGLNRKQAEFAALLTGQLSRNERQGLVSAVRGIQAEPKLKAEALRLLQDSGGDVLPATARAEELAAVLIRGLRPLQLAAEQTAAARDALRASAEKADSGKIAALRQALAEQFAGEQRALSAEQQRAFLELVPVVLRGERVQPFIAQLTQGLPPRSAGGAAKDPALPSTAKSYPLYSAELRPQMSRFRASKELEEIKAGLALYRRGDDPAAAVAGAHAQVIDLLQRVSAGEPPLTALKKDLEALERQLQAQLGDPYQAMLEVDLCARKQLVGLVLEMRQVAPEVRSVCFKEAEELALRHPQLTELADFCSLYQEADLTLRKRNTGG